VSWLERQHQALRAHLGLSKDFVIHGLRHTFGTRLGEVGTNAFTIKELMGHSSVTVTQRSVHPTTDTKERACANLAASNLGVGAGHKTGHSASGVEPKSGETQHI
jgi:integrase